MIKSSWSFAVVFTALLTLPSAGRERASAPAFLTDVFNISAADLTRVRAGHVVARTLNAVEKREVATLGVIRIKITPEFYVDQLRDIAAFKRCEAVLQIGTFGSPPVPADVAALTFDDADIRQLRGCKVGDCGVQLPADAISRFRQQIDWRRSDAHDRANQMMRQTLVSYVGEYMKTGVGASMRYADQPKAMDVRHELGQLAASDQSGWKQFPALSQHVLEYAGVETPGITDLIYWSKEKVATKNIVSVTHMAIARSAEQTPADYAVASKQIYGTHYYDASLALTVLVRDTSSDSPAIYVVYLNRSRIDLFEGLFGGVTRGIISGKARGTVADQLTRIQRTLEQQFAARQTAH